jgi:hypothetical protein
MEILTCKINKQKEEKFTWLKNEWKAVKLKNSTEQKLKV